MEALDLYKLAEHENIKFYYNDLHDCNGLYYNNSILLNNKILNTYKEKEVLAEELGHHFMGVFPSLPFSTDYYNKLIRSKNEFKAFKWQISKLIPFNKLNRLLSVNYSKYDIAEELGVSASLVEEAIEYYKSNKLFYSKFN